MLKRKDLMTGQPDVNWLIDGVLPIGYRALLYADSGVGKSFTALDIALHIATGERWQGHAVKQGTVYYLAAENPETFHARFQAWEKQHKGFARWEKAHPEQPDAPFYLDITPLDLSSKTVVDALLARLEPAQLVVIDTVLASMGAWDIKDTNQSYLALAQVNRIIEQTGATVLLVHHTPDHGYNPLGGSAWRGGIQTRIYLTRQHKGRDYGEDGDFQEGDTITLACKKLTGAPQFPNIVVPVRLVKLSRDLTVPVLASEKAKARSNPYPKPKLHVVPTVDLWTLYEENGRNAAKVADLLGEPHERVRKRIQRLQRNHTETGQMCADVPA